MMIRRLSLTFLLADAILLLARCAKSDAFAPSTKHSASPRQSSTRTTTSIQATPIDNLTDAEWIPLVDPAGDGEIPAVRKHIMEVGTEGDIPSKGSTIELEYTGTLLGERDYWSTNDVVECWLSQLQGLDQLAPKFVEHDIDGYKLMDESFFTEEYCTDTLGVSNKIQAKKLIMASRRLGKRQVEYAPGMEFDSSNARNKNYSFVLGGGKVIRAMELAVGCMRVGERSMVVCRSDYGYGSEGLRTSKGDVMVPPFATLCFELNLVGATK